MITAIIYTVAFAYMVGKVGIGFRINVAGKGLFMMAIRAGEPAFNTVIRFEGVAVRGSQKLKVKSE